MFPSILKKQLVRVCTMKDLFAVGGFLHQMVKDRQTTMTTTTMHIRATSRQSDISGVKTHTIGSTKKWRNSMVV